MPTNLITTQTALAFHGTGSGAGGGPLVLVIFLAGVITAAWVLFSKMRWRNTMLVTAAGWVLVLAVAFSF